MSVLIPFRDRVDLTQSCVASLRRCAGAVAYELILIDNGSEEAATKAWLDEQAQLDDVCVVRVTNRSTIRGSTTSADAIPVAAICCC